MEHESIFVLGLLFDPPGRSVLCLWRVNQWLYRWQKKTRIASHAPLFSRIKTLHIYVMERMHAKSHHIKSTHTSCVWFPPFPIVVGYGRGLDYNNQINKYNVGVIICVIIGKGWDRSRILN